MQSAEEHSGALIAAYENANREDRALCEPHVRFKVDQGALAVVALIRARDAEIRADERGRCSVVHATLTDDALVDELVRRGVLTVETRIDRPGRRGINPVRRYVTAWETDTRTPSQRSDDAVDELRRRLEGGAP